MAVDVFQVAEMLVAHAVEQHEDEISIIAYYGSHAIGTATPRSDLDLFYIPVEGSSPDAARSLVFVGMQLKQTQEISKLWSTTDDGDRRSPRRSRASRAADHVGVPPSASGLMKSGCRQSIPRSSIATITPRPVTPNSASARTAPSCSRKAISATAFREQ